MRLGRDGWMEKKEKTHTSTPSPTPHTHRSPLTSMFDDVYATPPWHLVEQREAAVAHARAHPGSLPAGVSVE